MPENFFGIGAYQHPDAASVAKVKKTKPRQKPRRCSRRNAKHTSAKVRLYRSIPAPSRA